MHGSLELHLLGDHVKDITQTILESFLARRDAVAKQRE